MAQWIGTHAALTEDHSLVPSARSSSSGLPVIPATGGMTPSSNFSYSPSNKREREREIDREQDRDRKRDSRRINLKKNKIVTKSRFFPKSKFQNSKYSDVKSFSVVLMPDTKNLYVKCS